MSVKDRYRETGLTPQMVKDLVASEKKAHKIALENADMLDEYQAIGTVEECHKTMEKYQNTSRKFVNPEIYEMTLIKSPEHVVTEKIISILCDKYGYEDIAVDIAKDIYDALLRITL